ncbi:MAG: RdgB/HAM1 family non-canonical purine NTP pyrophosphatase [Planctomycetota bacterium]
MKLLLATTNPHKLDEIRQIMDDPTIDWLTLGEIDQPIAEPVEDQDTFAGNARLKARHYAEASGMLTLADDSGLSVEILDGAPGVISARYSGVTGPRAKVDVANNRKLLAEMRGKVKRDARFVCAMCVWDPDAGDAWAESEGEVRGRILSLAELDAASPEKGRGANGFGYDPLFMLDSMGMTSAELSPDEKNRISHRGNAARAIWPRLRLRLMQEVEGG